MRVRRVGALGDQALPAPAAGLAEQRLAVAVAVGGEPHGAVEGERPPQQRLAGPQRERGGVAAGEVEQVEDVVEDRHRALTALLQAGEAGPRAVEGDDLAVQHGRRAASPRAPRRPRGSGRSGSGGCATAAARAPSRDRDAADPVELALEDPAGVGEPLLGEHRLHGLDPPGQERAAAAHARPPRGRRTGRRSSALPVVPSRITCPATAARNAHPRHRTQEHPRADPGPDPDAARPRDSAVLAVRPAAGHAPPCGSRTAAWLPRRRAPPSRPSARRPR